MLAKRLLITLCVAGIGYAFALGMDLQRVDSTSGYFLLATILLAIGLFSSTYDLAIEDLKRDVRVVLLAITLGVLAKAALIASIMYFTFRDPAFIVLGIAIAQIDPLSVAVMRNRSRLSARAKVILSAWSSLDDPVTVVLTIYLLPFALSEHTTDSIEAVGAAIGSISAPMLDGLADFARDLLGNAVLVIGAALTWWFLSWIGKRTERSRTRDGGLLSRSIQAVSIIALVAVAVLAVYNFWLLGLAIVGLFFRPGIGKLLSRATPAAFLLAIFVLGLVLADQVNFLPGLALGVAAFGAQIVVGVMLTWKLPPTDRIRLAFGQQSGITAVILALLLETVLPGTVAVVAPAILVINVLHLVSNTLLDRAEQKMPHQKGEPDERDRAVPRHGTFAYLKELIANLLLPFQHKLRRRDNTYFSFISANSEIHTSGQVSEERSSALPGAHPRRDTRNDA